MENGGCTETGSADEVEWPLRHCLCPTIGETRPGSPHPLSPSCLLGGKAVGTALDLGPRCASSAPTAFGKASGFRNDVFSRTFSPYDEYWSLGGDNWRSHEVAINRHPFCSIGDQKSYLSASHIGVACLEASSLYRGHTLPPAPSASDHYAVTGRENGATHVCFAFFLSYFALTEENLAFLFLPFLSILSIVQILLVSQEDVKKCQILFCLLTCQGIL